VDPALYNAPPAPESSPRPERTRAEHALLIAALKRDIPILGFCGGMQLLAVEAGGTLIQLLAREGGLDLANP
ncbi:gamma-glutamyl-gamma-aminobutyrate hydrolase family protein, partial [Neokomagataea anthophila]